MKKLEATDEGVVGFALLSLFFSPLFFLLSFGGVVDWVGLLL